MRRAPAWRAAVHRIDRLSCSGMAWPGLSWHVGTLACLGRRASRPAALKICEGQQATLPAPHDSISNHQHVGAGARRRVAVLRCSAGLDGWLDWHWHCWALSCLVWTGYSQSSASLELRARTYPVCAAAAPPLALRPCIIVATAIRGVDGETIPLGRPSLEPQTPARTESLAPSPLRQCVSMEPGRVNGQRTKRGETSNFAALAGCRRLRCDVVRFYRRARLHHTSFPGPGRNDTAPDGAQRSLKLAATRRRAHPRIHWRPPLAPCDRGFPPPKGRVGERGRPGGGRWLQALQLAAAVPDLPDRWRRWPAPQWLAVTQGIGRHVTPSPCPPARVRHGCITSTCRSWNALANSPTPDPFCWNGWHTSSSAPGLVFSLLSSTAGRRRRLSFFDFHRRSPSRCTAPT